MKFQNYFVEKNFIRGSVVQKEGTPIQYLHLILEGEFETAKTVIFPSMSHQKFDLKEFLP